MKTKNLGWVSALMVGGFLSTTAMAAPVDGVTMEVVDVDTQQTSDVTHQIEMPQAGQLQEQNRLRERHEYRTGAGDDESASGDMLREQARDRSELRDEQQSQTRDQIRDNAEGVKQETQDQLQDMQEVKQQLQQGQGMK